MASNPIQGVKACHYLTALEVGNCLNRLSKNVRKLGLRQPPRLAEEPNFRSNPFSNIQIHAPIFARSGGVWY